MSPDSIVLIALGVLTLIGATLGPYLQYKINRNKAPVEKDVSVAESAKSIIEGGAVVNEMLVSQLARMAKEMEGLRKEQEAARITNGKGVPEPAGPVIYEKLGAIEKSIKSAIDTMATRQRILLQTVEYPVFEADEFGKMVWVNKAASRFVGMHELDLLENGWVAAVHPDDVDRVYLEWSTAINTKSLYSSSFKCRTANGEYVNVHASAHPISDGHGGTGTWLGFITRDTADIDEAVEAILGQVEELMSRVEEIDKHFKAFKKGYDEAAGKTEEALGN